MKKLRTLSLLQNKHLLFFLLVATLALSLAACNKKADFDLEKTDSAKNKEEVEVKHEEEAKDEHEHEDEQHAHEASDNDRLVIGYEGGALVVNASDYTIIKDFKSGTTSLSKGADNRHLFMSNRDEGIVKLLDIGVWSENHEEHNHNHVEDPYLYNFDLHGEIPTHIVSHLGKTAIFYDGIGEIAVFDSKDLGKDEQPTPILQATMTAHHGVAVPLKNGGLVTSFADKDEEEPSAKGILVLDEKGKETARFESCPGLHGEAVAGEAGKEAVAFGCEGKVLLYNLQKSDVMDVPLPDTSARVSSLSSIKGSAYLLGNYSSEENPALATNIVVINVKDHSIQKVDLGTEYFNSFSVNENNEAFILGKNGKLYVVDLEKSTIKQELDVMEPIVIDPEQDTVKPSLNIINGKALITNPDKKSLIEVDLSNGEIKDVLQLEEVPTKIVSFHTVIKK